MAAMPLVGRSSSDPRRGQVEQAALGPGRQARGRAQRRGAWLARGPARRPDLTRARRTRGAIDRTRPTPGPPDAAFAGATLVSAAPAVRRWHVRRPLVRPAVTFVREHGAPGGADARAFVR